jgi:hypothetical protein
MISSQRTRTLGYAREGATAVRSQVRRRGSAESESRDEEQLTFRPGRTGLWWGN